MPTTAKTVIVTCPSCGTECRVRLGQRSYCGTCAAAGRPRVWLSSSRGVRPPSSMRASIARGFARPPSSGASGLSDLSQLAPRLAELQRRVEEARARGENPTPKVEWGSRSSQPSGSGTRGRDRPWTSRKAKPVEKRVEEKPPYEVTYWEADDGWFAVLIEGVEPTRNWRGHDDGISLSVNGDVLRIVDTRNVMLKSSQEGGKPTPLGTKASAVQEVIIPGEYEPNLHQASTWGPSNEVCQKGIGLLLKFPLKVTEEERGGG